MTTVAILLNPEKENAVSLARELAPWLESRGVRVIAESDAAAAIGIASASRDERILATADFALVLGGDGTLLRANRLMAPAGVPILGFRFGKFGFMTDIEPDQAYGALDQMLRGDYRIEERMMLRATVYREKQGVCSTVALNDVVIAKGPLARMLRLGMSVSGKYVSAYSSDGLIVATPTGSTAYSLSAGGPLVTPELQVIIITPICPHTLSARSLIVSSTQVVRVDVQSDPGDVVILTADGQVGVQLEPGDQVVTEEAEFRARLVVFDDKTFFDKLQTRLRWGDRFGL